MTTMLYIFIFEALMSIPLADLNTVSGIVVQSEPLFNLSVIVILMTLIPYYIETWGVKNLSPNIVTILEMLELVTACIVGYVFFGESMTFVNIMGMLMIVASILVINSGSNDTRCRDGAYEE